MHACRKHTPKLCGEPWGGLSMHQSSMRTLRQPEDGRPTVARLAEDRHSIFLRLPHPPTHRFAKSNSLVHGRVKGAGGGGGRVVSGAGESERESLSFSANGGNEVSARGDFWGFSTIASEGGTGPGERAVEEERCHLVDRTAAGRRKSVARLQSSSRKTVRFDTDI